MVVACIDSREARNHLDERLIGAMQMREMMDEDFQYFYEDKGFGPAIHPKQVLPGTIEKFRGHLPGQLLTYWERYGWCGYANGLF